MFVHVSILLFTVDLASENLKHFMVTIIVHERALKSLQILTSLIRFYYMWDFK